MNTPTSNHRPFRAGARAILPLFLAALGLAACSDGSDPLQPVPSTTPASADAIPLPASDADLLYHGVQLRPGVTVDLHVKLFANAGWPGPVCPAENVVLAVPGFAHTAATWRPYAQALFADASQHACALLALDPPGHGGSGLLSGILFGELVLDDYVTALLAVIDSLHASGFAPARLIGHSQGGLVIQMAQQRLLGAGSSLRQAGIREAELLAPVPPAEVPWSFVDSGAAAQLLGAFLVPNDPVLGPHAEVPDAVWPSLFFTNLSGQLASGAPTPAQVAANGYNAPAPLFASLQLVGAPPFQRPSISAGAFAGQNGTRLTVVAFEQDQLIRPNELRATLDRLTGEQGAPSFFLVGGAEAVHDLLVSNPASILATHAPSLP